MKSSPIFNIIHNNSRASDCSFGSRDGFTQDIRVGTSAKNSHTLAEISVTRFVNIDGTVDFSLFINGAAFTRGTLDGKTFTRSTS